MILDLLELVMWLLLPFNTYVAIKYLEGDIRNINLAAFWCVIPALLAMKWCLDYSFKGAAFLLAISVIAMVAIFARQLLFTEGKMHRTIRNTAQKPSATASL